MPGGPHLFGDRAPAVATIGPMRDVPDGELVKTLIGLGMPAGPARTQISNPSMRLVALRVWCDVHDAGRGDKQAKQRIDYIREGFSVLRREDLIREEAIG